MRINSNVMLMIGIYYYNQVLVISDRRRCHDRTKVSA